MTTTSFKHYCEDLITEAVSTDIIKQRFNEFKEKFATASVFRIYKSDSKKYLHYLTFPENLEYTDFSCVYNSRRDVIELTLDTNSLMSTRTSHNPAGFLNTFRQAGRVFRQVGELGKKFQQALNLPEDAYIATISMPYTQGTLRIMINFEDVLKHNQ